jgi:OmpA-OmpF porin, OOP family
MKYLDSLGRTFVLIALFLAGTVLIWQIGRRFAPPGDVEALQKGISQNDALPAEPPAPQQPPQEPVPEPAVVHEESTPEIVRTDRGSFVATDPILFNSGLTTLREASIPKLDRIARFLIRNPEIKIEIVGHTDNLGPEPVNRSVSTERAAIVMNYLVSQGIDPSRLRSKGMGSLDPIDSNDTQLGRQANRRIEFLITEGTAPARR